MQIRNSSAKSKYIKTIIKKKGRRQGDFLKLKHWSWYIILFLKKKKKKKKQKKTVSLMIKEQASSRLGEW